MPRTPEQAITWARGYIGNYGWDNLCLSFVRQAFALDYPAGWDTRPNYADRNAGTAWDRAKFKHRTTDPMSIPRGVPVFFELQTVADHVVLSLGDGKCLSNDFVVDGRIDVVDIGDIARRWGPLLGWTEDLLGQRVWKPAALPPAEPPKRDKKKRRRHFFVDVHPAYQAGFDFARAKAEGIEAAVIKCTEGRSVSYGTKYDTMVKAAKAAGLKVAAYHWIHDSDPADQAEHLANHIGDKTLPVMVDWEKTSSDPQLRHVIDFIDECTKRGMTVKFLYLPRWHHKAIGAPNLDVPALAGVGLWNSAYGINARVTPKVGVRLNFSLGRWRKMGGKPVRFLQFGSRVKVAGMAVDCNVFRGSQDRFDAWFSTKPIVPPAPEPQPEPDPKMLAGDVVTWNGYVRNPKQAEGLQVIVKRVQDELGRRADVIAVQESKLTAGDDIYQLLSKKISTNAALVKRWFTDVTAEWVPGSKGVGVGVNKKDRDICVVRYTKHGVKRGLIVVHAPFIGQPTRVKRALRAFTRPLRRRSAAGQHEKYARAVLEQADRLVSEGREVKIVGDGNARPLGDRHWEFALYRLLEDAGWRGTRRGLEIVFYREPTEEREPPFLLDEDGTGSNHRALVVPTAAPRP